MLIFATRPGGIGGRLLRRRHPKWYRGGGGGGRGRRELEPLPAEEGRPVFKREVEREDLEEWALRLRWLDPRGP